MSPATILSDRDVARASTPGFVLLLAWGLCALFVLLVLASVLLYVGADDSLTVGIASMLFFGYPLFGALVAVREPRNVVGWLMLGIAVSIAVKNVVDAYVSDLERPLVVSAAWIAQMLVYASVYLVAVALPLLFPNGRLLSARWRPVVWLGIAGLGCSLVSRAFAAWPLEVASPEPIPNPLAVTGVAGTVISVVTVMGDALFATSVILSGLSLVERLRRAHGRQRQQVKWFTYVVVLALTSLLLARVESLGTWFGAADIQRWTQELGTIAYSIALVLLGFGIPVAVGIAILRHRLYDIDLVIRRTLVYGALTLTLTVVYVVAVLSLPALLNPLAGDSGLTVAASTLAVAALFRPARTRIQQVVDRRFFRRKYNAARTVASFAASLGQEVDLDAVSTDLRLVVHDTVQPTHVSLWLREPA